MELFRGMDENNCGFKTFLIPLSFNLHTSSLSHLGK
jgi:hypothetical protein